MKRIISLILVLVLALGLIVCQTQLCEAGPMSTAFTYQGYLYDANRVADGLYDFQFKLFDDPNVIIGNQVGGDINKLDVDVIDGHFVVELDFGGVFDGDARWLEIGVRDYDPCDVNAFITLSPRQEVTPTPYAIYAKSAGSTLGGIGGVGTAGYTAKFTGLNTIGDSVIYESAGKVGIGTTNPGSPLHVVDTQTTWAAQIENTNSGGSGLSIKIAGPEEQSLGVLTGGEYKFIVKGNGNVGIGTAGPTAKLHIGGTPGVDGIRFPDGTLQTTAGTGAAGNTLDQAYDQGGLGAGRTINADAGAVNIAGPNGLTVNGNVGIGTTSPEAKLDVNGQLKITGGSPGSGKVLTSDASGLASWQDLPLGSYYTKAEIDAMFYTKSELDPRLLTASEKSELTGGGVTSLHYHPTSQLEAWPTYLIHSKLLTFYHSNTGGWLPVTECSFSKPPGSSLFRVESSYSHPGKGTCGIKISTSAGIRFHYPSVYKEWVNYEDLFDITSLSDFQNISVKVYVQAGTTEAACKGIKVYAQQNAP